MGDNAMQKRTILLLLPLAVILVVGAGLVLAERGEWEDEHEHGEGGFSRWFGPQPMAYDSQDAKLYKEECGSCHFPFQPAFLPAESWQAIMSDLGDHFGDNAELSDENTQRIANFLASNSAGKVSSEIPNKVMWSLRYTPHPKRITETAFFRHEHREIPPRLLNNNGNKLSFANCDSCHTRAMQGSYREHEIRVPGVGRWED
jgi:mono/diheme cytochrome c family protein